MLVSGLRKQSMISHNHEPKDADRIATGHFVVVSADFDPFTLTRTLHGSVQVFYPIALGVGANDGVLKDF